MYPNLFYFFKKFIGIEISWLKFINTFGFFVAAAFLIAHWIFYKELYRKQKLGMFTPTFEESEIGKPASISELMIQAFIGALIGYKLVGLFIYSSTTNFNSQSYIFSTQGNIIGGIIVSALFAYLRWREKDKQKLDKPKIIKQEIYPKDKLGDILMLAFIFALVGAKLFHNFENWNTFVQDPIGEMLSLGGLTFYGGLICASTACIIYIIKNKMPLLIIVDTAIPSLIIGYAIGRLGCQFSGDGDWGILNSAFISDENGELIKASAENFKQALINNTDYYKFQFGSIESVSHSTFNSNFLPTWLIAQNYPNNVISEGFRFANCEGSYCAYLPVSVFPTPLYESLMSFFIFFLIWKLRKKIAYHGQITAIYLIVMGAERFIIEKIRVNNNYHIGGLAFTQAELISTIFILSGIVWYRFSFKKQKLIVKK